MKRIIGAVTLLLTLGASGCISSSLVLQVFPDGHGRATITTRVYEAGWRAFDSALSAGIPVSTASVSERPKIEEELPPPHQQGLADTFGAAARLVSTKLEKTADGVMRTSVVEFEDVTKIRLMFPPLMQTPGSMTMSFSSGMETPLIRFAMKPHENGDRLLLVQMPGDPMAPEVNLDAKPPSAEEKQLESELKRAIKGAAIRLFVELDPGTPLLRTNAPASRGNRTTIVDLDLERLFNGLDAEKIRRAMAPGSMQELIWQLGDMPGAVVPTEHEVFLEFEPPREQPQPPPPARPAQPQGPPDTEIYLAPLKTSGGAIEIGTPINITSSPGYDNQPFFTPDGRSVLFTSVRGQGVTQSDIYRYDIASKQVGRVTDTAESEYSPTITPSGALSVIRVELDGQNTQRLWQFTPDGRDPKVVLEHVKPVGYHAWADPRTLALFILGGQGQPATLQVADTPSGTTKTIATDIGRSIQPIPGTGAARTISFVQRERHGEMVHLTIKELNVASGTVTTLTPAVEGATEADVAWTPDGTLLMAKSGTLYAWKRGQPGWKELVPAERLRLTNVTRLAVSPRGDFLALVGSPRQAR
jgi:hypothetical protein